MHCSDMTQSAEVFNKDELEPPQWLNSEFFTNVLHSCRKDETITLKSFKLTPGSLQGDHYASLMFRVTIEYESAQKSGLESMSLILKTMPEVEGLKKDLVEESYLMETETAMYAEVLPKFESILRSIGDGTKLGPRCVYQSLTPNKVIIFEDLVPLGYTVLRDRQPSIDEVKLALLKLAKMQAISYKINQEDPGFLAKFCHSFWDITNVVESKMVTDGIVDFIELLKRQPNLTKYKPHFEAMKPELIEKCKAAAMEWRKQPQSGTHYVLCHGDYHVKNMMFSSDDVMLLDYQTCYVGPMVNDIIYAIFMLMDRDLRKHNKDELINFYFNSFVDILQRIAYKGTLPKLTEFRQMFQRYRHLKIFIMTTFLPIWYGFRKGATNPEEIMTNSAYRASLYSNEDYIAELEELLPQYLHMGYLEC